MAKAKITLTVDSALWVRFRHLMLEEHTSASAEFEKMIRERLTQQEPKKRKDQQHEK